MKNKFLLLFIAFVAVSNLALAQSKLLTKKQLSQSEYIQANQIMLVFKGKQINMHAIKISNVVSFFGKPQQIKKEKSEIDDQIYTTYTYENGQIEFDQKGRVYNWDINKSGWACIFKMNDKVTQPFSLSSNLADVKKSFPHSWASNKRTDILAVYLITPNGTPVDAAIVFGIKNNRITFISLSENDS
jgi:hypothetical protein